MAYETNWEPLGIYRRFLGQTSDAEIIKAVGEGASDPRFGGIRYIIFDFTGCDEIAYTEEGAEILSALGLLSEQANPDIKIAIVTDTSMTEGMADAYMAVALNSYPTQTFAKVSEARDWLATQNT